MKSHNALFLCRVIFLAFGCTPLVAPLVHADSLVAVTITAKASGKTTYSLKFKIDPSLTAKQRETNATDDLVWVCTSGEASGRTRDLIGGFNTRLRLSQREEFTKGLKELKKASAKAKRTKLSGRLTKQIYVSEAIGRTFTLDVTPSGDHYAIVSAGSGLESKTRFRICGIDPVLKLFPQLDKHYAKAVKDSEL